MPDLPNQGCEVQGEHREGFTLIEMLVAVTITIMILTLLLQILGYTSSQWKRTNDNAKAFEGARAAFDSVTRSLGQASLATEYDYYNSNRVARLSITNTATLSTNFTPDIYGRYSGLHFISGKALLATNLTQSIFFQAPLQFETNQGNLPASGTMNAVGYYISYGDDVAGRPTNVSTTIPTPRTRSRLMQFFQPTEGLDVYRDGSANNWFLTGLATNSHIMAENIVALVVLPKLPDEQGEAADFLAPSYEYDSRTTWTNGSQPIQMHQLPPVVRVVMVAIDETSALRDPALGKVASTNSPALFQDPTKLTDDLEALETSLRDARANYRIFQTDVPLRSAKWSE